MSSSFQLTLELNSVQCFSLMQWTITVQGNVLKEGQGLRQSNVQKTDTNDVRRTLFIWYGVSEIYLSSRKKYLPLFETMCNTACNPLKYQLRSLNYECQLKNIFFLFLFIYSGYRTSNGDEIPYGRQCQWPWIHDRRCRNWKPLRVSVSRKTKHH